MGYARDNGPTGRSALTRRAKHWHDGIIERLGSQLLASALRLRALVIRLDDFDFVSFLESKLIDQVLGKLDCKVIVPFENLQHDFH